MMTKEKVLNTIIEHYKNGSTSALSDYCDRVRCADCPFNTEDWVDDVAMAILERLTKVEEQSKSLEKTCYKLQQALQEKIETNFDHYYDGKLAFDDFVNTGEEKLIADVYTLCFKTGTDETYKKSGIRDFKRWLLSPYEESKPKYKLSKFEYDMLECYHTTSEYGIKDFWMLEKMQDKGYFKDVPNDAPIKVILDNCEVVD